MNNAQPGGDRGVLERRAIFEIGLEPGAPNFSQFFQNFPVLTKFHSRFLELRRKKGKGSACLKATGARSADRIWAGARSSEVKKGRSPFYPCPQPRIAKACGRPIPGRKKCSRLGYESNKSEHT